MPEPHVYEVRCQACNTSFAAGTRQCVHCGRRIGGWLAPPEPDPRTGVVLEDAEHAAAEEGPPIPTRGRTILWIATAIFALVGSLLRTCQGG